MTYLALCCHDSLLSSNHRCSSDNASLHVIGTYHSTYFSTSRSQLYMSVTFISKSQVVKRVLLYKTLASVAQLDARPTGDQKVAGSTPTEVGNILSWRLIMKYFLRSFSPFR